MLPSFRSLLVAVPAMLGLLIGLFALLPAWLPAGGNVAPGTRERLLPFAAPGQEPESRAAQRSDNLKRLFSIQFGPVRAAAHEPAVRIERTRPLTGMAIPSTPVAAQPPRRVVVASLRPRLPQQLLAPVEASGPSAAPPRVHLASLPAPSETPEVDAGANGPTIVARELIELPSAEEPVSATESAPRAPPSAPTQAPVASAAKKSPPPQGRKPNAKPQGRASAQKSTARPQAKAQRKSAKPARAAKPARPAAKRAAPQRAAQQPAAAQQPYALPFWDSPPAAQMRRGRRTQTPGSEP